jgi:glycerol-3-phosphate acyltransferase PlsX
MGANVECRPLNLIQFAVMGAAFARKMHDKRNPRVGLLSNGAEEHKGTDLTRGTHRLLEGARADFDYVGYVEGRDVFSGKVDVVVCDGFSGNLVLKVTEGAAETLAVFLKESINESLVSRLAALALMPAFSRVKARMDYAEQGGAPLLGVNGVCIICHGGSNAKAIKNAIIGAGRYVDRGLPAAVGESIEEHGDLMDACRGRQHHGDEGRSREEGRSRDTGRGPGEPGLTMSSERVS